MAWVVTEAAFPCPELLVEKLDLVFLYYSELTHLVVTGAGSCQQLCVDMLIIVLLVFDLQLIVVLVE